MGHFPYRTHYEAGYFKAQEEDADAWSSENHGDEEDDGEMEPEEHGEELVGGLLDAGGNELRASAACGPEEPPPNSPHDGSHHGDDDLAVGHGDIFGPRPVSVSAHGEFGNVPKLDDVPISGVPKVDAAPIIVESPTRNENEVMQRLKMLKEKMQFKRLPPHAVETQVVSEEQMDTAASYLRSMPSQVCVCV